jgi:large-conductance mechanosensitive channel
MTRRKTFIFVIVAFLLLGILLFFMNKINEDVQKRSIKDKLNSAGYINSKGKGIN